MIFGKPPYPLIKVYTLIKDYWKLWEECPHEAGRKLPYGYTIRPFSSIRTCVRRAAARPVRACFVRTCCTVFVTGHDTQRLTLQCSTKQAALCCPKITLHNFTLQSSHSALHTFALHTPHSTLYTSHFIALRTSTHLISHLSSSHLSSSHLIFTLLTCHQSYSALFSSSEHCLTFVLSSKLFLTQLSPFYASLKLVLQ